MADSPMVELEQITDFLHDLDKLKQVKRQIYRRDGALESDTDHTWHMLMYAIILYPHTDLDLNLLHSVKVIGVHDIGELDPGDAFAYDVKARERNGLVEDECMQRLSALLPKEEGKLVYALWKEFVECRTPEAKYANAIDKLQALGQNISTGGRVWKEKCITEEMCRNLNREAMTLDTYLTGVFELFFTQAKQRNLWYIEK